MRFVLDDRTRNLLERLVIAFETLAGIENQKLSIAPLKNKEDISILEDQSEKEFDEEQKEDFIKRNKRDDKTSTNQFWPEDELDLKDL